MKNTYNFLSNVRKGSLDTMFEKWCGGVLTAARRSIHVGSSSHKKGTYTNPELCKLIKKRQCERKRVRRSETTLRNYNSLSKEIKSLSTKLKTETWPNKCKNLDLKKDSKKVWSLLKNLTGAATPQNPSPIRSKSGRLATSDLERAQVLKQHFAESNKQKKWTHDGKNLESECSILEKSLTLDKSSIMATKLIRREFEIAFRKCKNDTAGGPDGITYNMLNRLGPKAKTALFKLISLSWETGKIPKQWQEAKLTAFLKKGKPPDSPGSYRPVSLTSCAGKIAERIVNRRLYWFMERNKLINHNQCGFRKNRQATDQIIRLTQNNKWLPQKREHDWSLLRSVPGLR
ncbi:unnamed protein product [Lymnaea stagnalis]|uniref:Reverse transcriptase domain-containing protein n=1 Tax=Lymnaea stagnalis TaxID=6523 RepID=A0AAV2IIU8_LYMST